MNQKEKNVKLATAVVSLALSGLMLRLALKNQDRQHAKRMKAVEDLQIETEILNNRLMAIANHLDDQLSTANFWEIVTRP